MTDGRKLAAPGEMIHFNGGLGHCLDATVADRIGDSDELVIEVRDDADQMSRRHGVNLGTEPGTWHWPE